MLTIILLTSLLEPLALVVLSTMLFPLLITFFILFGEEVVKFKDLEVTDQLGDNEFWLVHGFNNYYPGMEMA